MLEKLKKYFKQLESNQQLILNEITNSKKQAKEVEWAAIYHDSIRGKKWLEELPINVGRWAGNYSFFYVLNRILNDYKPKKILELGLGESSKVISAYIDNYLTETSHLIIEQDENWATSFKEKFTLSKNSTIEVLPLKQCIINNFNVNSYNNFAKKITDTFDLYVVDGPFGSDRFSRYDIISLVKKFKPSHEFIILFDDTNRKGEFETCEEIKSILEQNKINFFAGYYEGIKGSTIIASEKYKYATSL